MNKKHIIFSVFIVVVIAQLFIPAKMIYSSMIVLKKGVEFKFKVRPIDPNDPFRGKYIVLDFEAIDFTTYDSIWHKNQDIMVFVEKDEDGFAMIKNVLPGHLQDNYEGELNEDYNCVNAKVAYVYYNYHNEGEHLLRVKYPFTRFYMEESKAYPAEKLYRDAMRDSTITAYAIVNLKLGEAVLDDVQIDGISIKDLVEERQKKEALDDNDK